MSSIALDAAMPLHEEAHCEVAAGAAEVFEHIDQPARLSAHMARKSWQLGGASMSIEPDATGGRAVGSHIHLVGRILGRSLSVECVVKRREPPRLKAWQTIGMPQLLVIGPYRMSVTIQPQNSASDVTIAIDYALSSNQFWRVLGPLYARWCVRQMATDIIRRFGADA